ncbi:hypothetical protein HFP05_08970 [Rhodanobacter denitrificans]|nr:hypothetical protein [Rhodanobacter denitrificans]
MSSRHAVLIATLLVLAGCQTAPVQPQLPKTVYIEVDKFVPLDASLLQDCPIEQPRSRLVSEAVRVANARKLALQRCNEDKAAIRAAQPAGKP